MVEGWPPRSFSAPVANFYGSRFGFQPISGDRQERITLSSVSDPFQTTYYLNGHSFIEQELKRAQIGFRKTDNAFLAVDGVAALQAAADKLSPQIIRQQLDYWTLILGPKFSVKERKQLNLSRFYAIAQIEYCRNFIFKRNFPIHKLFERGCELGLWRLTADKSPRSSARV